MLIVELLLLVFADRESATDFLANYLAGDDLIPLRLLEVFPRDALLRCLLFQIVEGPKFHVLAHLVELFDQISVAVDAEILSLLEKQLLVHKVTENILFTVSV